MSINLAQTYLAKNWPIVPVPHKEKGPIIKDWPNLKITNDNVHSFFTDQPQNVSVILGQEGSHLVDLDLDCPEAVYYANLFAPETGYVYGRASNPSSHRFYKVTDGQDEPAQFMHPDYGMFLEIRSKAQASVLPGSVHPSDEVYKVEKEGQPSEIQFDKLRYYANLIAICCLIERSWPAKGSRQNAAMAVAGLLCKAGYQEDEIAKAIYHISKRAGDEEADKRCDAAKATMTKYKSGQPIVGISAMREIFDKQVLQCLTNWLEFSLEAEIEELVSGLNKKYAFVVVGGAPRILAFGKQEGEDISFLKLEAFKGLYKNQKICVGQGKNGPLYKSHAEIWLDHSERRTYESMTFEPEKEVPSSVYNYWHGFAIEPAQNGDGCKLFMEHLRKIVCGGNEEYFKWLLGWLAQMIQHPGEKPGTAVVLIGPQGAGKTCVGEYIAEMLQPHVLKINNSRHLVGHFNAHQHGIVFALCEEAFLAGDKMAQGILKDLITSPITMIERKGVDPVKSRNCLHLFITSNNPWVVSAAIDDRRFFVLDVLGDVANNEEYFTALKLEQEHGGPAALLHVLQNYDYSGVNLRKPPLTKGLIIQKIESLEPLGKVLYKFLSQGYVHPKGVEWPEWVETEQFCDLCFAGTKKVGLPDKGLQTKLGMTLPKFLGPIEKSKKTVPEIDAETGKPLQTFVGAGKIQQMVYILPSLDECRKRFTEKTSIPFLQDF